MSFQFDNENGEIRFSKVYSLQDIKTLENGNPREGSTCSFRIISARNVLTGHNQNYKGIPLSESKYYSPLEEFDESNRPSIAVTIGQTSVSELDRLLDVCLTRLHIGEVGEFEIKCSRSKISCCLRIELISIEDSPEIHSLKSEQILSMASSLKEQGVELFSQGFAIDAFYKFSKASKYMNITHPRERNRDQSNLLTTLHGNMASCHVKVGNWEDAIDLCNLVLLQNPNNIKALYRRGLSYIEIQEFEKANDDLLKAKHLDPENQAVMKKLAILDEKIKVLNAKYAQAMKKFFS